MGSIDLPGLGKGVYNHSMKKRILVVTPRSPFLARGADELERLSGMKWFITHGYEVKVITKTIASDVAYLDTARAELGIPIISVPYKYSKKRSFVSLLKRFLNPYHWDGAAFEYFDPETQQAVQSEVDNWKPDLVWFDFTYLWPLHHIVKKAGIPVVTRSLNYEPRHFLEEEGISLLNILLYFPKYMTERFACTSSDVVLALNPNEEKKYISLGAKKVYTLPLQAIPTLLHPHGTRETKPLHVLFMGSSYTVGHNLAALDFIVKEVVPEVTKQASGEFVFHVTGSKFPKEYESYIDGVSVVYDGYVPKEHMDTYFDGIDCMISPTPKRVGMQGKVFEPLARSIPLITSPDNVVGYPFVNKKSVLFATTKDEYVHELLALRDFSLRTQLSTESGLLSNSLFSREKIDAIMNTFLAELNLHI